MMQGSRRQSVAKQKLSPIYPSYHIETAQTLLTISSEEVLYIMKKAS